MDEKKTGLRISTFILNAFWRSLYALNAFLFAVLFLQFAILCFSFFDFRFPLPQWAESTLRNEISKLGIETKFSQIYIDMRGDIVAESVSARFSGTPKNFLVAKRVSASIWYSKLFGGAMPIKALRILDARVGSSFKGAEYAPVVSNLFVDVHSEGQWWNVETLTFSFGNLRIMASGYINENFDTNLLFNGVFKSGEKKQVAAEKKDPVDIAKTWEDVLSNYPTIEKYISKFSLPMLNVSFSLCGGGEDKIALDFVSSGVSFEVEKGKTASVDNLRVRMFHKNYGGENNAKAFVSAENFSMPQVPTFRNITARSDIVIEPEYLALENLDVIVQQLAYDGTEIGNVQITKDVLSADNLHGDWCFYASLNPHKLGGTISLTKDFDVKFWLDGKINPSLALNRKELADIPELKQLAFPDGIKILGGGEFYPQTSRLLADVAIESHNCTIMNIPVDIVRGRVCYSSDTNIMDAIDLKVCTSEGWDIEGEFIQNFANNQYFVRVLGDIRPMAIAHFMEPWWTRVMKDFNFVGEKNFPHADVSVEGTWGAPEYIWCFAHASGENAKYNGADFSGFSLNVLVNPRRISLYDVAISAGSGGSGMAQLDWLYKNGITSFYEQKILMDSTLSPAELIALAGDDAREIFDVVKFEQSPKLKFNATMRNTSNNPENLPDFFNAQVVSSGGVSIEMVRVENISFFAKSDKINTDLENLKFDFCGGSADGTVDLKKAEKGMYFDASLRADKMNQLKFTEFLMSLGSSDKDKKTQLQTDKKSDKTKGESIIDGGENGVVSATISLKGITTDFENSYGAGYVSLDNSDLIKLHLFGDLSRALSALSLPFGSFNLTYAHSPFEIANGTVKFPKLEMGGPVMQIQGAANYNFVKNDLDSSLAVIPFGKLSTPIISNVVSLINPITSTVEVYLEGALEDPKISVKVNPVNAIRSQDKIVEKIRDEL